MSNTLELALIEQVLFGLAVVTAFFVALMRPSFVRAFLALLAISSGGAAALLPIWLKFEAHSLSQYGGALCVLIGGMCLVSTILQAERRAEA